MRYLSDEWFDTLNGELADAPPHEGAAATVEVTVAGTPDGKVTYSVELAEGGRPVFRSGAIDDPPAHVDQAWDDALAHLRGEREPVVHFMAGHTKVKGSSRPLYELWSYYARPEFRAALDRVAAKTDTPDA